ncbi:MAG: S-layer homology domain-containing protein [Syntrophomonas sp.]|nr:S-layer homology domain-containing protein [Syntrophomonas sp.]
MKKKIWRCCLLATMVLIFLSAGTCMAANQVFQDTQEHWAKDYINELARLDYVAGNPDGTFKPDKNMTKAEFTRLLISCMGINNPSDDTTKNFSDTAGNWAIKFINEAAMLGILEPSEYPDGLQPDGAIKRSEACAMLVRALGKLPATGMTTFNDNDKVQLSEYRGFIKTAADLGLMSGYSTGNFEPFADLPRGQACTVLYKYLYLEGKIPTITPPASGTYTPSFTGNIRYVSIDGELYDTNTVPVSFIIDFIEVPAKSLAVHTSGINLNNTYIIETDSSKNADIVVHNVRYAVKEYALSGDKLEVTVSSRKIHKFEVGNRTYNSDYVYLYVASRDEGYYLSDMTVIDDNKVKIGNKVYNLSNDKITISANDKNDFYDIVELEITDKDNILQLKATDPVVMDNLGISDIAAIFVDNSTLDLGDIDNIYFIIGGTRYDLSEVTLDATGNFNVDSEVYSYDRVKMVIDELQYEITLLHSNKAKFIFYCDEGSDQEWVIVDDKYYDTEDVKFIKGASIYDVDEVMVVSRNLYRIDKKQYTLDSNLLVQVDNKTYTIYEIYWDAQEQATVIETDDDVDSTLATQPQEIIFYNDDTRYQKGTQDVTIYAYREWVSFSKVFISDPAHYAYKDKNYDLIGAELRIDGIEFEILDTAWHGSTAILDIFMEEQ